MTDVEKKVQFRSEGDPAFPIVEKDPSSDSPADKPEVDPAKPDDPAAKSFHEDPKVQEYIERQVSKRIDGIETKLRDEFKGNTEAIKKEIGDQRQKNADATKIPPWFGGNQAQWDSYREWFDGHLQQVEERAISRTFEKANTETSQKQKLIDEATAFFNTEIAAITADKTLNPSGKPIDPNALLKAALDNDLVDSKGRWNYRAAVKFLKPLGAPVVNKDKKLADITLDRGGRGDGAPAPKNFKTAEDFKKKRPW